MDDKIFFTIISIISSTFGTLALFFLKGILVEIKNMREDIKELIITETTHSTEIVRIKEDIKDIKAFCKKCNGESK